MKSLTNRELNRALLARQMLLRREPDLSVINAIEQLVGLQAQNPRDPYVSLWSRLEGFDPAGVSDLLEARRAVRISLMRSTIHLVSDRDCLAIRPVLQPWLERNLYTATPFGRRIDGIDVRALARAARAALEREPMMFSALGRLLSEQFPDYDAEALGYAAREYVPLVQVPPRGLWGRSARALHVPADVWVGRRLRKRGDLDALLRRYLAAFGPATLTDFGAWSGLDRGGREGVSLAGLRAFTDERGRELLDVPGAPLPDPSTPSPIRFLPDYDNALLGHSDRSRIFYEGARPSDVIGRPTVLVDGFVAGFWKFVKPATVEIRMLARGARREVRAEARALLGLLVPGSREKRIDIIG